jgi:major tropism determinant Mtd-like protein
MAVGTRMQQRRATAAIWAASGYILADGELGLTTDTGIIKIGDGVNLWSALEPAFDSQYLPILGTAANSELLGGVSVNSLVKVADTSVTATNNSYVKRTADGGVKGTDATELTELTSLQQMNAAVLGATQLKMSRIVTAAATLALTDAGKIVFVNHASTTTQVTVTVPQNSTVAFPIGTIIEVTAYGAGGAKVIPAVGGIVGIAGSVNALPGWGTIRLVKTDTDSWYGITANAGKRLPKVRAVKTISTSYNSSAGFPIVPYDTIDAADTYNPDNEWFFVPPTGLTTARRIGVNKDGEYLLEMNFYPNSGANQNTIIMLKMVGDNTIAGSRYLSQGIMSNVGSLSKRVRLLAGETVGCAWSLPVTANDRVDGTDGFRNDFSMTRLSD